MTQRSHRRGAMLSRVERIVELRARAIMPPVRVRAINVGLFLCFMAAAVWARWGEEGAERAAPAASVEANTGADNATGEDQGLPPECPPLDERGLLPGSVLKTSAEPIQTRLFRIRPFGELACPTTAWQDSHPRAVGTPGTYGRVLWLITPLQIVARPIRSHAPPVLDGLNVRGV